MTDRYFGLVATAVIMAAVVATTFTVRSAYDPPSATAAPPMPVYGLQEADPAPTLLETLEREEGFRGSPYDDSEGFATIGFGTKLPLTRAEAEILLRHRLAIAVSEFRGRWPHYDAMPPGVQDALSDMSYQLGPAGTAEFTHMLTALERRDWDGAADAALQSRWATETPARANRVAEAIRRGR